MSTPTHRHLGEALEDLVSTQPFSPDPSSIEQRGAALRRRAVAARVGAGVAVGAVAAMVAVTGAVAATGHGTNGPVVTLSVPAGSRSLTELASYITADPAPQAGDATLVQRTQAYPGRSPVQGFDLYTDSGEYFYAGSESGLPGAIASNANQGDGMFTREVAAAEYAVRGDLSVADRRMAYAAYADGKPPTRTVAPRSNGEQGIAQKLVATGRTGPGLLRGVEAGTGAVHVDNSIWENCEDALQAGAGNAEVRAGVLRILSTLPGISVAHTQVSGRAAIAITANGAPDLPADYHETITIDAVTGVPISLVGATNGAAPGVSVTYRVSRVTVSAIEAGHF